MENLKVLGVSIYNTKYEYVNFRRKHSSLQVTRNDKASKHVDNEKTNEFVRKVVCCVVASPGDPVRRPSSFSAFAYHSGMHRSLPGALCSWYPRTIASRNLLDPLT